MVKDVLLQFDPDVIIVYDGWNEICELSHEQGFDIIISIQPIIGTGNKPLTVNEKQILDSNPSYVIHSKLISDYVSAMYDLKKCNHTFDLTTIFDNVSEQIYFDQGHMSDNGNLIVAKKFTELLYPILKNEF